MYQLAMVEEKNGTGLSAHHETIRLHTGECLQFIDLTKHVGLIVERSGIRHGFANIQTKHTTTALIVNENEPLLLEDLKRLLEDCAPRDRQYEHNDFSRRIDIPPDEPANGHSHCKALFLPTSIMLNVADGVLQLGRWQSLFWSNWTNHANAVFRFWSWARLPNKTQPPCVKPCPEFFKPLPD